MALVALESWIPSKADIIRLPTGTRIYDRLTIGDPRGNMMNKKDKNDYNITDDT